MAKWAVALSPPLATARMRSQNLTSGSLVVLAVMTCSNAFACALNAASNRGWPWPSDLHHQLAIASNTCRPSASCRRAPFAATTSSGGNVW